LAAEAENPPGTGKDIKNNRDGVDYTKYLDDNN
jgi:hypothetical protein